MATLRITRSREYTNRLRDITILLDGAELAKIKNGETREFQLAPGNYTLQAKIDWCTCIPQKIRLSDHKTTAFMLESFAKHHPLGMLAAIYYTTVATGKYLVLTEM